jgi:aldehyde dehydrogenase (NAD+)
MSDARLTINAGLDVVNLISEIDHVLKHLSRWTRPTPACVPGVMYPAVAEITYEPYGVCLIIGAFNFPIILTLSPLIGNEHFVSFAV